ncbi:Histidine-containing [Carex littledalei]|uniref:Histidine-containing n=1 Tax=Carex littledalei TaxID=544730 RepID=A0A833VC29_9POAL|nr:Histidine-containing [Carex littledalei]
MVGVCAGHNLVWVQNNMASPVPVIEFDQHSIKLVWAHNRSDLVYCSSTALTGMVILDLIYFMWDSFMTGVSISIMMNSEKYRGINDYAEMDYMNMTVITLNKPYGALDGSNPLFDGHATPRSNLKQGRVHSGHVQNALDDIFCTVNASSKGICEMTPLHELRLKHSSIMATLVQEGMLDSRYPALKEAEREDLLFAHQIITQFFGAAETALHAMRKIVRYKYSSMDQHKMGIELHLIKGPSDYIGTLRVTNVCRVLRDAFSTNDRKRCLSCIKELKKEFNIVKPHLEALMELEKQIWAAGGRVY